MEAEVSSRRRRAFSGAKAANRPDWLMAMKPERPPVSGDYPL